MKIAFVCKCFVLCFLALINKSDAAVYCGDFYSVGAMGEPEDTFLLSDNITALITIRMTESVPVDSLLYTVYWNETVTDVSLSIMDENEGMNYMDYTTDLEGNKLDVVVTQSLSGIVDYNHPNRTEELNIYLDILFEDETTCLLALDHIILDDNTNAPHFNESSYGVDIREDFPLYLDIPGLKLDAYDYDASDPSNTFNISVDPECPMKVSEGGVFICDKGQAVPISFVLTGALDYDTMVFPYQINCIATLQDYGDPQLTSISTLTLNVLGYPDELPQFTSNYYIGTLSSDLAGTVVDVNPPISAMDKDVPPTAVTYTMATADASIPGMSYFFINDTTAEVSLLQDLDADILAYEQISFFLTAVDADEQSSYSVLNVILQTLLTTAATCGPCFLYSTCLPCDCISETSLASTFSQSPDSTFDSTISESTISSNESTISESTNLSFESTVSGSTYSSYEPTTDSTELTFEPTTDSTDLTFESTTRPTYLTFESTISESTVSPIDSTISGSTYSTASHTTDPSIPNIEFLVNGYVFQILTTSRTVGQVEAEASDGSTVTYSWKNDGSSGQDYFNIEKNTGRITAKTDQTPIGNFELIAIASADGLKSAESLVTIVVYAPYNSSYVVMLESVVYVETPENDDPSILVTLQVATSSGNPMFCIESVTPSGFQDLFSVDSATGDLSTTANLNADDPVLGNLVTIIVGAYSDPDITCGTNALHHRNVALEKNQALVYVTVTDQNDNPPLFVTNNELAGETLIFAYPSEIAIQRAIGPIGYVRAVDADVTSSVSYSIESYDNSPLNYAIDQNTGEIYLTGSFNCFTAICSMKVIASDSETDAVQPIKIIGLTPNDIHTMILDNVDIADVDATLENISNLAGVNIHQLYSSLLAISGTKVSNQWQIQVQVYAESGGQLMGLDEFNSALNDSGFNSSATYFSDSEAFSSIVDNSGYKVAVGILGAALGIILIVGIVILVKRNRKKQRMARFPPKHISTLGKTYAHQMNQTEEKQNGREESFFTIFGNGSISNKSITSIKSTSSVGSTSTKISNDTVQGTKTKTIEAYNNYAMDEERPYLNGSSSSSTFTKAEVHSDNSGSLEEKPKIRSYYLEWEKQQESQKQRKDSSNSIISSVKSETFRKSSLELYPSLANASSRNSRNSTSNSSTNSEDSISNIRRVGSKELMTEDPDRKSVSFKVLLETKEYEPDPPEPIQEEKSVSFKILVETKQIEADPPEPQDMFTIL